MRIVVDRKTLATFWEARFECEWEVLPENKFNGEKTQTKTLKETTIAGETEYIELPFPFESTQFSVYSNKDRFWYNFDMVFRNEKLITGLSKDYDASLLALKKRFFPTTEDITGYIKNADNDPLVTILEGSNESGCSRLFYCGKYGSQIKRYGSFTKFSADVEELSTIANHFINYCVRKHNTLRDAGKVTLPHMDLFMGIDIKEE